MRTGYSSIAIWFELCCGEHLNIGPHFAVAESAKFMARHQQVAGVSKFGVHLRYVARHNHGIHICPDDKDAMNYVGRGKPQGYQPSQWKCDAVRDEHELCRNNPCGYSAIGCDDRPEILLSELAREVQIFWINPFDITRRIDIKSQRREYDDADRCGYQHADTECPKQFGAKKPVLMPFVALFAHGSTHGAAR